MIISPTITTLRKKIEFLLTLTVFFTKKNLLPYENDDDLGHITFYGRAELKTSDHRPVIAYIDVNVLRINGEKRLQVFESLLNSGPPDATVLVNFESGSQEIEKEKKYELLEKLFCGKNVCIRVLQFDTLVTFPSGKDALEALEMNNKEIDGITLLIKLKSPDWKISTCKIIKLCQNNTTPLLSSVLPLKPLDSEFPFHELLNEDNILDSVDCELNEKVLSSLECHRDFHAVQDDGSKSGSPVKLPPRPPPPVKASVPMRPPPPQRAPLPSEKNSCITSDFEENDISKHQSEGNTQALTTISNTGSDQSYKSCPPPSAPPPPPPDLSETQKSGIKKSAENITFVKGDDSSMGQPPPIPSRPKLPSVGPPPLPARPSAAPYLPPVAPRKSTQ